MKLYTVTVKELREVEYEVYGKDVGDATQNYINSEIEQEVDYILLEDEILKVEEKE